MGTIGKSAGPKITKELSPILTVCHIDELADFRKGT